MKITKDNSASHFCFNAAWNILIKTYRDNNDDVYWYFNNSLQENYDVLILSLHRQSREVLPGLNLNKLVVIKCLMGGKKNTFSC